MHGGLDLFWDFTLYRAHEAFIVYVSYVMFCFDRMGHNSVLLYTTSYIYIACQRHSMHTPFEPTKHTLGCEVWSQQSQRRSGRRFFERSITLCSKD